MAGLLDTIAEAYMRNVGNPARQLVGGGVRGLLGFDPPEYADSLGMEAYRNAQALSMAPTPLAFAALPAAMVKGAKAAKAPQIAKGLLQVEANAMAPTTLRPEAGVVEVLDDATRKARMDAMGMERGWYRGGPKIENGKRSGPWYTQDATEAAGYAKQGGEVREYAIPKSGFLMADGRYGHKLPNDVAKILDDPYFGKPGQGLAKELRTYGPGEGITGGQLWQALEARFGNDGAAEVLQRLGAFKGAKGMTRGDEAYVFKNHPVRDAEKAAFDLAKYGVDDIFGGATLPVLGLLGGTGLGVAYLGRKD